MVRREMREKGGWGRKVVRRMMTLSALNLVEGESCAKLLGIRSIHYNPMNSIHRPLSDGSI